MSTIDGSLRIDISISKDEQEALRLFGEVYCSRRYEIQEGLRRDTADHQVLGPLLSANAAARSREEEAANFELERQALIQGEWGARLEWLRGRGRLYAQNGVSITAWFDIMYAIRRLVVPLLLESYSQNTDTFVSSISGLDKFVSISLSTMVQEYIRAKEEIILKQQETLYELSTPVLQLLDRLLLIPIVGGIDSMRARQITEQLLHSIQSNRAKVVVLDVTGVPAVDSAVANHLLQTVSAARLMGATSIVTGLSVEIAQTLTRIGVDLSSFNTVGDLRDGLKEAERLLGYPSSIV